MKGPMFVILGWVMILGYTALIFSPVVWIWFGWYAGCKASLSALLVIIMSVIVGSIYTNFIKRKIYARNKSQED